jgi:H2-forming N5,N10-methylenetetrahydromethanopterin dehydrogenase-like enzyme
MATSFGKEIIEIMREDQRKREDRVLKETCTIQPRRQIFELACEHFRNRGEGKS